MYAKTEEDDSNMSNSLIKNVVERLLNDYTSAKKEVRQGR